MNKLRLFVFAVVLIGFFCVSAALAQTPANISVVSGNGQMICPACPSPGSGYIYSFLFDPMVVKVTDANGNPVSGAVVTWLQLSGNGFLNGGSGATTTTDSTGQTSITYIPGAPNTNQAYIQSQITATISTGSSVSFYLTQVLPGNGFTQVQVQYLNGATTPPCATCVQPGDTVSGAAGSTSNQQVAILAYGAPGSFPSVVPNVSLRLLNNQTSPSVSCATGAGADPGTVLTDATGTATCTIVFGPGSGTGSFVVAAGLPPTQTTGSLFLSGNININVTPGVPGSIKVVSGNNQSANAGSAIATPLVAQVGDTAGNPLSGQQITWSVTPSNAATLSSTTTTSDANGQVHTSLTLSPSAGGQVKVTAALTSNPQISTTFTITVNTQVTGLQILSGNNQSAAVNAAFSQPLIVQLSTSAGAAVAGVPVQFTITGPASFTGGTTSTSVNTNSSGQAQVAVTAGSSTGAVTVSASAGGFSQNFSLTVIPPGPALTASSFFNGADFQRGSISPCSIVTIIAPGVAPTPGTVAYNGVGALPYTVAGVSVSVGGAKAPIYNVSNANGQQQVTFQMPCDVTPGSAVPVTVNVSGGSATVNVPVLPASPGLFLTPGSSTVSVPVVERPDGSFVSSSNPARRGEQLIAFVTGLGPTTPAAATNALPAPGTPATVNGTVIVGMTGQGIPLIGAQLSPDLIGVYMVAFQIPSSIAAGNNTFSIGIIPAGSTTAYYSATMLLPVQ